MTTDTGTKPSSWTEKHLFKEARTHHFWQKTPVSTEQLRELYELMKWPPTAVNGMPARLLFLTTPEAKSRLIPALLDSNVQQVNDAPVTVIVAHDLKFYQHVQRLYPAYDTTSLFAGNEALANDLAFRNAALQGAYMMMAARTLGLDVGPMSGFDPATVDRVFFEGTSLRANFLCNIGHGDVEKLYPRGPRLAFDEVCTVI